MVFHIHQATLFEQSEAERVPSPEILYLGNWFADHEGLFSELKSTLHWNKKFRSRFTVSFGLSYTKSSGLQQKRPFPVSFEKITQKIEQELGYSPNNCLANYYPTGHHYINFHSDQDMEMQAHSGVCIVSLGTTRHMQLRKIDDHRISYAYPLAPGSLFYMTDQLQKDWQHGIPTESGSGERISLSFRALKETLNPTGFD